MIYLRSILFESSFYLLTACLAVTSCVLGLFTRRIFMAAGRVWGLFKTLHSGPRVVPTCLHRVCAPFRHHYPRVALEIYQK